MSFESERAIEFTGVAVIIFLAYLLFRLARSVDESGYTYRNVKWFMFAYVVHTAVVGSVLISGLVDDVAGLADFLFYVSLIVFAAVVARQKVDAGLSFVQYFSPLTFVGFQVIRIPLALILSDLAEDKGLVLDSIDIAVNAEIVVGIAAIPIGWLSTRPDKVSWRAGLAYSILGMVSWINLALVVASSLMTADMLAGYPGMTLMFVLQLCFLAHLISAKHFRALLRWNSSHVSR